MGTKASGGGTAAALFGKARLAVLALLFTHADRAHHLREIARASGCGQGAVQRELGRLVGAGLVTRTRQGNLVLFQANHDAPVFQELRGLMVKTAGVADVLRAALAPLSERLELAFIYGSVAEGAEGPRSDVDLVVIGDVSFGEAVDALRGCEAQLAREVNPLVYPTHEARAKLAAGDHFLTAVMRGPMILLIGDDQELGRLAG